MNGSLVGGFFWCKEDRRVNEGKLKKIIAQIIKSDKHATF